MVHAISDPGAVLAAVGDIYAAPGDTQGWRRALHSITDLVGAKACVYMLINKQDLITEVSATHGFEDVDTHAPAYEGEAARAKDIRMQYLHRLRPGRVFREFEFVPDRHAYDRAEWTRYALEHFGVYYSMSALVSTHGLWQDFISVNRLKQRGPHTDREKAHLQLLLPHLSRAAELHRTLTSLDRLYGAVLSVLDQLLVGLVIVDPSQRVFVANASAREICEGTGVVRLTRHGTLKAADADRDIVLRHLLAAAIRTAAGDEDSDGGQLALTGAGGDVLAEVIPFRDDSLPDRSNVRGAAVFLMDPQLSRVVTLDGIAQIFDLTPSEANVATAMANGLSVNQIAEQRKSAVGTIRKQLKSTFAKTGANSQLELLRLAVKATPPVRKYESSG